MWITGLELRTHSNMKGHVSMIIYQITNNITGDIYIGKTTQKFSKRINSHKSIAKRNKGSYIHRSINKYGFENFSFSILDDNIISENDLNEKEIFYIEKLQPKYNLTFGGDGVSGFKQSPEHIQKRTSSYKGKPLSEETKRKLSLAMKNRTSNRKGVKLSEETRKKMSESHLKRNSYR